MDITNFLFGARAAMSAASIKPKAESQKQQFSKCNMNVQPVPPSLETLDANDGIVNNGSKNDNKNQ